MADWELAWKGWPVDLYPSCGYLHLHLGAAGWQVPTLPLPAKCDYCGRDGGANFTCDGCGAPRKARAPFGGPEFVDVTGFGDAHATVMRVR